jgi:hypothetical protein
LKEEYMVQCKQSKALKAEREKLRSALYEEGEEHFTNYWFVKWCGRFAIVMGALIFTASFPHLAGGPVFWISFAAIVICHHVLCKKMYKDSLKTLTAALRRTRETHLGLSPYRFWTIKRTRT